MAMIVADSDVLIDTLRGRPAATARVRQALESSALATTAVTAFELRSGVRSDAAAAKVEALLAPMPHLPFDEEAACRASHVRRGLD